MTVAVETVAAEAKRPRVQAMAWVQYGYVALFVLCVFIALNRAAELAGRWYLPAQGDEATGNAFIWDGVFLSLVWMPIAIVLAVGPYIALVVCLVSLLRLGRARFRDSRGLLTSTVLLALTVIAALSPIGRQITGWVLD